MPWYKAHGWPVEIPSHILPENTGFMAQKEDGSLLACLFFYISNSRLCWAAWPVTNPAVSYRDRYKGLRLVVKYIQDLAKAMHPDNQLMAFLGHRSLISLFEKENFKVSDHVKLIHWA